MSAARVLPMEYLRVQRPRVPSRRCVRLASTMASLGTTSGCQTFIGRLRPVGGETFVSRS
jgi:hypothetical protein